MWAVKQIVIFDINSLHHLKYCSFFWYSISIHLKNGSNFENKPINFPTFRELSMNECHFTHHYLYSSLPYPSCTSTTWEWKSESSWNRREKGFWAKVVCIKENENVQTDILTWFWISVSHFIFKSNSLEKKISRYVWGRWV